MATLIDDLIVVEGKNPSAPAGYEILPVDINKGAGGEYLYLCMRRKDA